MAIEGGKVNIGFEDAGVRRQGSASYRGIPEGENISHSRTLWVWLHMFTG
jgi:hypothetical protein